MRLPRVELTLMIGLLTASLCPRHACSQDEFRQTTVVDAAANLTPRLGEVIRAQQQQLGRVLTVAVFPFGDVHGKVSEQLFFGSKTIQGELAYRLRNESERKFIVWDMTMLKENIARTGADVGKIKIQDYQRAAEELRKLGLDVAVVGSYQIDDKQEHHGPTDIHADILFSEGAPAQASATLDTIASPGSDGHYSVSTRFSVEVVMDDKSLPLYQLQEAKDYSGAIVPESERMSRYADRFDLELDRGKHYGQPFTIRLRNHGAAPVGWLARSKQAESTRYFCAAVFVDGVSSIYEQDADGEFRPSQRHPNNVTKWVLTSPGVRVLPGYDTDKNNRAIQRVRGAGGATVDIEGFQLNSETAAQFEFGDAGESFAHELGMTKDIGVIAVYFYSERLRNDEEYHGPGIMGAAAGGVRQGPTIPQETFRVRVVTHDEPVESWQIFYRYKDDADALTTRRGSSQEAVSIKRVFDQHNARIREYGDPFVERQQYERMQRLQSLQGWFRR